MPDSGASIPVWCSGAEHLKETFPQAESRKNLKGLLSGFGEGFELADVYYIPRVVLSNGQQMIVLNRTYLPVVNRDSFGANLILQCHSLWYTMKYYPLSAEEVSKLQKKFKQSDLSDGASVIGAEGELEDELAQLSLSGLTGVAESFAKEDQFKQLEDDLGQSAMKEEDEVDINHEEERIRKKTEEIMREYGLS